MARGATVTTTTTPTLEAHVPVYPSTALYPGGGLYPQGEAQGTGPTPPLADVDDVTPFLGPYGQRLPAWVDTDAHLRTAHARARALLAGIYGSPLGALSGEGTELVRIAEAGLAAAGILRSLAAQQQGATAVLELAALLTRDALALLAGRVPGLVVAGGGEEGDTPGGAQDGDIGWTPGGSLIRDPYARPTVPSGARWSSGVPESVWFSTPEVIHGV